jgi:hypothetical protein
MTYVLPRLMKDSFNEMEELFMHMSYDQSMQHTVVDRDSHYGPSGWVTCRC